VALRALQRPAPDALCLDPAKLIAREEAVGHRAAVHPDVAAGAVEPEAVAAGGGVLCDLPLRLRGLAGEGDVVAAGVEHRVEVLLRHLRVIHRGEGGDPEVLEPAKLLDSGLDALLVAAVRLIHRVPDKLAPAP